MQNKNNKDRIHDYEAEDLIGRQNHWLGRLFILLCLAIVLLFLFLAFNIQHNGIRLIDLLVAPMAKQLLTPH